MLRRKGPKPDPSSDPTAVYLGLRSQALLHGAETITTDAPSPVVLGAVVDIPSGKDHVTLVSLVDGTTSLYTSTGGGTIGGGAHAHVAAATRALLHELAGSVEMFPLDDRVDLPGEEFVQFTLLTPEGRRRASVPAKAFWGQEPSTVVNLIAAAQDVLTALRSV